MKEVLFQIAMRIAEAKGSVEVQMACAGTLKEMFIEMGHTNKEANTMALDGLKIATNTLFRMIK